MNTIRIDAAVSENMGCVRKNNEDNFYLNGQFLTEQNRDLPATLKASESGAAPVFGVFDGMGGEERGEDASYIAATTLHSIVGDPEFATDTPRFMLRAIDDANSYICRRMTETGARRIGTTFAAVCFVNDRASVYNIGDSRVYLLRDGRLSQVSVDDTNGQRLLSMGLITREQLATHPDRHQLTQHLGIFKEELKIEPHIRHDIYLKAGDKFLICSDGLTDMVSDADIERLLAVNAPSAEITQALVAEALKNGGRDNVTAMVITVTSGPKTASAGGFSPSAPTATAPKPRKKASVGVIVAIVLIILIGGIIAAAVARIVIGGGTGEIVEDNEAADESDTVGDSEDEGDGIMEYFTESTATPTYIFQFDESYKGTTTVGDSGVIALYTDSGEEVDNVEFASSDEAVFKIDAKTGEYAALSVGTVSLTALHDGSATVIELTVHEAAEISENETDGVEETADSDDTTEEDTTEEESAEDTESEPSRKEKDKDSDTKTDLPLI